MYNLMNFIKYMKVYSKGYGNCMSNKVKGMDASAHVYTHTHTHTHIHTLTHCSRVPISVSVREQTEEVGQLSTYVCEQYIHTYTCELDTKHSHLTILTLACWSTQLTLDGDLCCISCTNYTPHHSPTLCDSQMMSSLVIGASLPW